LTNPCYKLSILVGHEQIRFDDDGEKPSKPLGCRLLHLHWLEWRPAIHRHLVASIRLSLRREMVATRLGE